ncbi:MAG: BamA/TamA family outer membrane protein [Fibrobacterota bacterium]|nr:BamA/TamA family outer membrane protein [Fibrobacterota bacterium]
MKPSIDPRRVPLLLAIAAAVSIAPPSRADDAQPIPAPVVKSADLQRWGLVPILMSNAETGVQAGALVIRYLNPGDTLNKSSTFGFAARVSQKMQVEVNLFPEWYLKKNLYHVTADLNYIRWPADFYGLSNASDIPKDSADPYLAQGVNGSLTVERELLPGFSLGPQALFKYEDIEADGAAALFTNSVPGFKGGLSSGIGAVMTLDKRDEIYWARRGCLLRTKAAWYRGAWGSEFDFDSYSFEARQFLPLFETGAIGVAATLQLKNGNVPFRELSTPDGDHIMRGMVRGKYRDRHLLVVQGEYKSYLPDWNWLSAPWIRNRLGWAVFTEAGQVAHEVGDFAMDPFRAAFGFGIRYAMNPDQKMNIRVDIGFVDGSVAPAINIKEAF